MRLFHSFHFSDDIILKNILLPQRQFKVAKKVLIVGPKQLFVNAIYRQLVYFFRQIARFRRVSKQSKTGRYW
jgi:hypothetical protein